MFRKQSWLIVLAVVGITVVAAVLLRPEKNVATPVSIRTGQLYPEAKALEPFTLINHKGESFTRADLQGLWSFVFFGYTTCPDVCPMTLGEMARLQSTLPEVMKKDTQFIFVTVDPERDTVEQLAQYMPFFNADIIGLTGTENTTAAFARQLGVAFAKVPQEHGSYLMDHSVRVFLLNPNGERHALFAPTQGASFRADELLQDYLTIRQNE